MRIRGRDGDRTPRDEREKESVKDRQIEAKGREMAALQEQLARLESCKDLERWR